jgi:hypothetical protein
MRILLVNQFFYPDPAATSQLFTDLGRGVAAEGHSVRVICGSSSYAEPDAQNPPAVGIIRTLQGFWYRFLVNANLYEASAGLRAGAEEILAGRARGVGE